jgi:hypothetical protein
LWLRSVVELIKLFWHKFNLTFCKLDHFINVYNTFVSAVKNLAYLKDEANLGPKSFMRLTPGENP